MEAMPSESDVPLGITRGAGLRVEHKGHLMVLSPF